MYGIFLVAFCKLFVCSILSQTIVSVSQTTYRQGRTEATANKVVGKYMLCTFKIK